jgi:hypothetical protein
MYWQKNFFTILGLTVLLMLTVQPLMAQTPQFRYGKNRIQYKTFNWQYYSTDNFDVYYYENGQEAARMAAEYMEQEYERITDMLGYAPYSKSKIFLFNSASDLQQSNVGIEGKKYTVSGQTNFVKLQVEVAHPGTTEGLKRELVLQTAKMLINDMMYGGNLTDILQNAYLLTLPEWFVDGAALYVAEGWNIEMDDYMRDMVSKKKIKKLSKYSGQEAALLGQSIWNYMAVKYGKSSISNVLNLTRIIRNEENSIESTLSVPYKQFIFEWQSYYEGMAQEVAEDYEGAPSNMRLRKRNRRGFKYNKLKISPDGKHLAYSEHIKGKYKVYIRNTTSKKKDNVFSGGYKPLDQSSSDQMPLISWKDSETLGIIAVSKGRFFLWLYDVNTKSMVHQIPLDRFNQVKDFSFAPSGSVAVVSADMKGSNDLYLLSVNRGSLRKLTNDLYDDINPQFIPGTSGIVFSSNRTTDSLKTEGGDIHSLPQAYNLFVYDVDTTKEVLGRLTNSLHKNYQPIPTGEGEVFYLSDEKGIVNVYKYNMEDSTYQQVSNFNSSIENFDLHHRVGSLVFSTTYYGDEFVYFIPNYPFDREKFTQQTRRQEVYQANYIQKRKGKFRDLNKVEKPQKEKTKEPVAKETEGLIDTDNYQFEAEVVEKKQEDNFFLQQYHEYEKETGVEGPFAYQPRFSASNILTSLRINPLYGFGLLFEVEMSDLLENHKFYAGLLPIFDFQSGKIFTEYRYLKNRLDYHFRYDRHSLFRQNTDDQRSSEVMRRYILNQVDLGASLPISVASRISATPFFANTQAIDLDPRTMSPNPSRKPIDHSVYYAGLKLGFTVDNTRKHGLNMLSGTRMYTGFEHYQAINDSSKTFSNFTFDFRHYQPIFREFVLAGRVFYGQFFNMEDELYLLGGMNNWLFYDIDNTDSGILNIDGERENSNVLFTQFLTPLRGYDFNAFSGTSAVLANVELRLPIVRIFYRGPIESNFFRNLQFTGFVDAGTAWTGGSPFAEGNSLNTEVVEREGSQFVAVLKNYRNPWLIGYGTGVRTVLFGYYLKFDVAWPYRNYEIGDAKFYFTLGVDF